MQDIWRLSAAELAGLIRSKKVSAKEAASALHSGEPRPRALAILSGTKQSRSE